MREKSQQTKFQEEEFEKIQQASKIKGLPTASFIRMTCYEKSKQILKEEKENDTPTTK